jgi:hypothetical protein
MERHTIHQRIPIGVYITAAIVVLLVLIGCMAFAYVQWQALASSYPFVVDVLRIFVPLSVAVFFAWGVGVGVTILWRRLGWRESVYAHYQILMKRAEVQVAPMAQHYHHEVNTTAGEALALAAPPPEVIKPMSEWMPWIDEQPHTLPGGKTKAGKTWLATAILERRIDAGHDIFIIDPHSSDWMGLPVAGGSGSTERREALKAVLNEYLRRMAQREEHKRRTSHELPHDYFDPLTVLIDEANAMMEELGAEWKVFLKVVASGSRKVGISLLLLAQSPLVEDLGISGAMRENFARIAVDDRTVQTMIDNERDKDRKQALQAAFKTMDRPAAAQIGAQTWLLDRRGLQPGQASSNARIWAGWDYENGRQVSRVSPATDVATPLSDPPLFDNDVADAVISPGAGVAPVATVALEAQEIAQIANLLTTLPTSEVVKRLDGYNSRNYQEMKRKVEAVKQLMEGKQ